jgi:hypothetical protein
MKGLKNILHAKFEGYYILEDGRIYSTKSSKFLKGHIRKGYRRVNLRYCGSNHYLSVHKLVLCFLGPDKPSDSHEVNHIDGDKLNNNLNNLQWVTRSENITHAYSKGLIPDRTGAKNSNAKLTKAERRDIIKKKVKGFKSVDLAEMYNVHPSTINRIVKRGY